MPKLKKKKEKKHDPNAPWLSIWILTYNTLRVSRRYIEILEIAWEQVLKDITRYIRTYSSKTVTINTINEKHVIERGGKYHKIHLHSHLQIDSNGLAMLDYDKIKEDMDNIIREVYQEEYEDREDYTEYTQGYFNGKIVLNANAVRKIGEYLEKAPLKVTKKIIKKRL